MAKTNDKKLIRDQFDVNCWYVNSSSHTKQPRETISVYVAQRQGGLRLADHLRVQVEKQYKLKLGASQFDSKPQAETLITRIEHDDGTITEDKYTSPSPPSTFLVVSPHCHCNKSNSNYLVDSGTNMRTTFFLNIICCPHTTTVAWLRQCLYYLLQCDSDNGILQVRLGGEWQWCNESYTIDQTRCRYRINRSSSPDKAIKLPVFVDAVGVHVIDKTTQTRYIVYYPSKTKLSSMRVSDFVHILRTQIHFNITGHIANGDHRNFYLVEFNLDHSGVRSTVRSEREVLSIFSGDSAAVIGNTIVLGSVLSFNSSEDTKSVTNNNNNVGNGFWCPPNPAACVMRHGSYRYTTRYALLQACTHSYEMCVKPEIPLAILPPPPPLDNSSSSSSKDIRTEENDEDVECYYLGKHSYIESITTNYPQSIPTTGQLAMVQDMIDEHTAYMRTLELSHDNVMAAIEQVSRLQQQTILTSHQQKELQRCYDVVMMHKVMNMGFVCPCIEGWTPIGITEYTSKVVCPKCFTLCEMFCTGSKRTDVDSFLTKGSSVTSSPSTSSSASSLVSPKGKRKYSFSQEPGSLDMDEWWCKKCGDMTKSLANQLVAGTYDNEYNAQRNQVFVTEDDVNKKRMKAMISLQFLDSVVSQLEKALTVLLQARMRINNNQADFHNMKQKSLSLLHSVLQQNEYCGNHDVVCHRLLLDCVINKASNITLTPYEYSKDTDRSRVEEFMCDNEKYTKFVKQIIRYPLENKYRDLSRLSHRAQVHQVLKQLDSTCISFVDYDQDAFWFTLDNQIIPKLEAYLLQCIESANGYKKTVNGDGGGAGFREWVESHCFKDTGSNFYPNFIAMFTEATSKNQVPLFVNAVMVALHYTYVHKEKMKAINVSDIVAAFAVNVQQKKIITEWKDRLSEALQQRRVANSI